MQTRVASQRGGGPTGLGRGWFPFGSRVIYRKGLAREANVCIYCMLANCDGGLHREQDMPKRAWSVYSMYVSGAWLACG
jgi:hypothetical protein